MTLKRQLESKSQALVILNKELTECQTDRDQFQLMAEKLQEKCSALKRVYLKENNIFTDQYENPHSIATTDSKEVECLRQKLRDALGDIKVKNCIQILEEVMNIFIIIANI